VRVDGSSSRADRDDAVARFMAEGDGDDGDGGGGDDDDGDDDGSGRGSGVDAVAGSRSSRGRRGTSNDRRSASPPPPRDPTVFLATTRACGLGLTLTSASLVIIADPDWNPAADAQAQGRCHRIGQLSTVRTLRLASLDSIEERVIERQEVKERVGGVVVGAGQFDGSHDTGDARDVEGPDPAGSIPRVGSGVGPRIADFVARLCAAANLVDTTTSSGGAALAADPSATSGVGEAPAAANRTATPWDDVFAFLAIPGPTRATTLHAGKEAETIGTAVVEHVARMLNVGDRSSAADDPVAAVLPEGAVRARRTVERDGIATEAEIASAIRGRAGGGRDAVDGDDDGDNDGEDDGGDDDGEDDDGSDDGEDDGEDDGGNGGVTLETRKRRGRGDAAATTTTMADHRRAPPPRKKVRRANAVANHRDAGKRGGDGGFDGFDGGGDDDDDDWELAAAIAASMEAAGCRGDFVCPSANPGIRAKTAVAPEGIIGTGDEPGPNPISNNTPVRAGQPRVRITDFFARQCGSGKPVE
jgi:hypothetical protein